eukprot:jgi/Ulvmu1/7289/UM035_0077.1
MMLAIICPCDSYIGLSLEKKFAEAGHQAFRIGNANTAGADLALENVLGESEILRRVVADASIVACDLNACCEASLRLLSLTTEAACHASPKVFIAVSNPMVWACTDDVVNRVDASASSDHVDDNADVVQSGSKTDVVGEMLPIGSHVEDDTQSVCVAEFSAAQYEKRVPAPGLESLYQSENAVLFQHSPDILRTYVVCPGVLYGNGECSTGFYDLFSKAWQADEMTALPVFGSGNNIIPTIHVDDCASFVVQLALSHPDIRYLFATDDSRDSQASVVKGISERFASGEIVDSDPVSLFTQQGVEQLLLNLRLKRTDVGLEAMHARGGLVANLTTVSAEFIHHENLQPLKILITGPPCSGKSALADHLGCKYSLPVIRVAELLAAAQRLQPQDASAIEQALKGGKSGPGRLSPEQMAKLGRVILSGVPHRNRGFIMDGFPRTLREARELFTDPWEWTPVELDENAAVEAAMAAKNPTSAAGKGNKAGKSDNKKGSISLMDDVADPRKTCKVLMPDYMIVLDASDEVLQTRSKVAEREEAKVAFAHANAAGLPAPKLPVSHHNQGDQARRTAAYKELRAADDLDREHKRAVVLVKWELERAAAEAAKLKAEQVAEYRRTHRKRQRKPVIPARNQASSTVSASHEEIVDPVHAHTDGGDVHDATYTLESTSTPLKGLDTLHSEPNVPVGYSVQQPPEQQPELSQQLVDHGPQMSSCGGFMAFFKDNGCQLVELSITGHAEDCSAQAKLSDLDRLARSVQEVMGPPRNYVGLIDVSPIPEATDDGQVSSPSKLPRRPNADRLAHTLAQEAFLDKTRRKSHQAVGEQYKTTMKRALMHEVMPAVTAGLVALVEQRPLDAALFLSDFLLRWAGEQDAAKVDPYDAPIYDERRNRVTEKARREKDRANASIAKAGREKEARDTADTNLREMLLESMRKHASMLRS